MGRGPFPHIQRAGSGRGLPPALSSGRCETGGMCPEQSQLGQAGTGLVSASLSTTWPLSEEAPAHPPGDPGLGGAGLPRRLLQRGCCSMGGLRGAAEAWPWPRHRQWGPQASKERKSGPPGGQGLNARASGAFRAQLVNPQAYLWRAQRSPGWRGSAKCVGEERGCG